MIIVKICEGLGNQLFQYALYRSLKEKGKEVYLDISWYEKRKEKSTRTFRLELYNTSLEYCIIKDKMRLANADKNILYKLHQTVVGKKNTHFYEKLPSQFDEQVFMMDNVYLDGYWQSEKYFKHVSNIIKRELTLKSQLDKKNSLMRDKILQTNAVSVHIRRGDYLNNMKLYGNICDTDYYLRALEYMNRNVTEPYYFVFSDDIIWAREFFSTYKNVKIVDINDQENGYKDLYLMSLCKHNIIANSSFSWWASWLNNNTNKIVLAPKKWLNNYDTPDIACDYWKVF